MHRYYTIFVEKPGKKKELGGSRRWMDNIKADLEETGCHNGRAVPYRYISYEV
jgi:hypothetical protein